MRAGGILVAGYRKVVVLIFDSAGPSGPSRAAMSSRCDCCALISHSYVTALRELSKFQQFEGLSQAARVLRRRGLPAKMVKRLTHLDSAYHVARHISERSCDTFLHDLARMTAELLPADPTFPASSSAHPSATDGNPLSMHEPWADAAAQVPRPSSPGHIAPVDTASSFGGGPPRAGLGGAEPHPNRTSHSVERSTTASGRHDVPMDGDAAADEVDDENEVNTTLTPARLRAQSIEDASENHTSRVDSRLQQCEQRVQAPEAGDAEERPLTIKGTVKELERMGEQRAQEQIARFDGRVRNKITLAAVAQSDIVETST